MHLFAAERAGPRSSPRPSDGFLRRLLRRVRRGLLPSFDLVLLARRRFLRGIGRGSAVLDAGCGDGTFSIWLAQRGRRVVGVSNDAGAIGRLRSAIPALGLPAGALGFRVHDLARDGPPGSPFDAALCFDVLEHIRDDRAALRALAASLREGGRLLLTVPDRAGPRLWGDTESTAEDGGHVRAGYTRAELEALLREAGLRPLRWAGFAGFFTQKAMNASRRLERRPGAFFLLLRFLWLVAMRPLCGLDPLVPWPPYEIFVMAEKGVEGGSG